MTFNVPLIAAYVLAVLIGLALAGLAYCLVEARTHIRAHGLVAGLMEWWLYGRQSNWSKEAVVLERRSDHVKSIRVNDAELEHLIRAAAKRGLPLGQFIKRAAIQQASDDRMRGALTSSGGFGYVIAGREPPA